MGVFIEPLTVRASEGDVVPIPTPPLMMAPPEGATVVGYQTESHPHAILRRDAGAFVPIPKLPFVRRRIFSMLLVRNARPKLSVVPTKFDVGSVPAFHAMAHGMAAAPVGVCHEARPVESDMRIFPAHGAPPVIFTCPATSSLVPGFVVPIPTFPEVSMIILDVFPAESKL